MSQELHRHSASELAALVARREASPREIVDAFLARIETRNRALNAFVTLCADRARAEADRLGDEAARGRLRGPLHGVPVAVKDLTDTAGVRTTYGSGLFREHVPEADAEPVARLRAAGAIVLGKANTHEFACGTTTDNPHYGATHNPWRHGHVPGGSSGGSAAAVGAGLAPLATGSDTGGSIRVPSALCGCVGMKPTHGRVSLRGTFPMAASFDHVGPIARTARDCAVALTVMAGHDRSDVWSRALPPEDFARDLDRSLRGLRVAVAPAFRPVPVSPGVAAGVERAIDALRGLGARVVEVDLPDGGRVLGDGGLALIGETYVEHVDRLARHRDAYGEDVRVQLEFGASIRSVELVRAQRIREEIARAVADVLRERADVLLLPTTAIEAPPIGIESVALSGEVVPVLTALAGYTILHNLTRLPTVAVPAGPGADGLPTSVQLTTAHDEDALALAVAHQVEQALWPHAERWPD